MLNRLALSARSHNAVNLIKTKLKKTNYYDIHLVSGGLVGGFIGIRNNISTSPPIFVADSLPDTMHFILVSPIFLVGGCLIGALMGPPGFAAYYLWKNTNIKNIILRNI